MVRRNESQELAALEDEFGERPSIFRAYRGYFFFGVMVLILMGVAYFTFSYDEIMELIWSVHRNTAGKLTTTPVPEDWRAVDLTYLEPEEQERVKEFALLQGVYDTLSAAGLLLCVLYALSLMHEYNLLSKKNFGATLMPAAQKSKKVMNWLFETHRLAMYAIILSVILIVSSMYYTFKIGGSRENPWYIKLWYGEAHSFYYPWQMIGMSVMAGAFVAVLFHFLDSKTATKIGSKDAFSTAGFSDLGKKMRSYSLIFAAFYVVYEFYGVYLLHTAKESAIIRPYLYYLFPFFTTLLIAGVVQVMGKDFGITVITLIFCFFLIFMRQIGQKLSTHWLFNDSQFWAKILIFALFLAVGSTILKATFGKKKGDPLAGFKHTGTRLYGGVQRFIGLRSKVSAPEGFVAALAGAWFSFACSCSGRLPS